MATEGEVGGQTPNSLTADPEDLSKLKCQPCHEDGRLREVVGKCTDCQDYLCRKCFDSHTLPRPFEKHQLLDTQQMIKSKVKLQGIDNCTKTCSLHDDDVIKYYCIVHSQLGCSVCLSLKHRTCKPVHYIPDVAENLDKNDDFNVANKLLNMTLQMCKQISDLETENIEAIETSYTEVLASLDAHRRNVNDTLDKVQAAIVEKTKTMKVNALSMVTGAADRYRDADKELQEIQNRAVPLQRKRQNCDLYAYMMQMIDRLGFLKGEMRLLKGMMLRQRLSLAEIPIHFTPNLDLLEILKKPDLFGHLKRDKYKSIVAAEHIQDLNVKTSTDDAECWVTGTTLLPVDTLVIADHSNSSIKAVDMNQNQVITQTKVSSRPWGICKVKHDQVAVALWSEKKIAFVDVSRKMIVNRKLNVGGSCYGLDFKDDKLAVSFIYPHKVQVLKLDGAVLHNITMDHLQRTLFHKPYGLAFGKDSKTLYVSNYTDNSVVCVKLDGTLVATYTDSELQYPIGIVVDNDDDIVYVCGEMSNNIHQIYRYPDLSKLKVLLRPENGVNKPQHIHYNGDEDKFYVGMINNNIIKVYSAVRWQWGQWA